MKEYDAYRSEIDVFRSELKFLNDKYHEHSISLAKYDVFIDTIKKNIHGIKGMQEIMNAAQNEQDHKINGFETQFAFTKNQILSDLGKFSSSIKEINKNIDCLNKKITDLEQSSKFKEWMWKSVIKNYKILSFVIMAISFSAIVIYELKKLFPSFI